MLIPSEPMKNSTTVSRTNSPPDTPPSCAATNTTSNSKPFFKRPMTAAFELMCPVSDLFDFPIAATAIPVM